jgi:hypothetical protein
MKTEERIKNEADKETNIELPEVRLRKGWRVKGRVETRTKPKLDQI